MIGEAKIKVLAASNVYLHVDSMRLAVRLRIGRAVLGVCLVVLPVVVELVVATLCSRVTTSCPWLYRWLDDRVMSSMVSL